MTAILATTICNVINIESNTYIFTTPNLKSYRTRKVCTQYIIFSETR